MLNHKTCVVVDYGMGNVFSVMQALRQCGAEPVLTGDPDRLRKADRVILPGVGAFKNGIQGLINNDLIDPLLEFAVAGKPLLGICLGMQMFGTNSLEFGEHEGLNLIPGKTKKIPSLKCDGTNRIIPFVGWRNINVLGQAGRSPSILDKTHERASVYLVHSYQFIVDDTDDLLATYDYDGITVTAAIKKDNITGVQFHPEKSDETGINILREFISE
jgi:imidazole glycerol-phosphate synthase subunit HisH